MKRRDYLSHAIFSLFLVTIACTTVSEIRSLQAQLREKAKRNGAFKSAEEAVKNQNAACTPLVLDKSVDLEIDDDAPLMLQDSKTNLYDHFKVLCAAFPDTQKYIIEVISQNKGGGMGKTFFLLPKLTFFNKTFQQQESTQLSGQLHNGFMKLKWITKWSFIPPAAGTYPILVEGINTADDLAKFDGKANFQQAQMIFMPMPTGTLTIHSYPIGKLRITLRKLLDQ